MLVLIWWGKQVVKMGNIGQMFAYVIYGWYLDDNVSNFSDSFRAFTLLAKTIWAVLAAISCN